VPGGLAGKRLIIRQRDVAAQQRRDIPEDLVQRDLAPSS
jgi:hypothetical protein